MTNELIVRVLEDISRKLDIVISLLKIGSKHAIDELRRKVEEDSIAMRILEIADGTLTYSEIARKVAQEMEVSESTVKRKISKLRSLGLLIARRGERGVYYEASGLI